MNAPSGRWSWRVHSLKIGDEDNWPHWLTFFQLTYWLLFVLLSSTDTPFFIHNQFSTGSHLMTYVFDRIFHFLRTICQKCDQICILNGKSLILWLTFCVCVWGVSSHWMTLCFEKKQNKTNKQIKTLPLKCPYFLIDVRSSPSLPKLSALPSHVHSFCDPKVVGLSQTSAHILHFPCPRVSWYCHGLDYCSFIATILVFRWSGGMVLGIRARSVILGPGMIPSARSFSVPYRRWT